MHTDLDTALQLLRQRRPGHMLPRECYFSEAVFRADLEAIWYREWVFAGHSFEIAEEGQFFTLQIGDFPVVVVRNGDGDINAFVNVCSHRGTRVCQQAHGDVARLVCPYHGWTYDLNGELIFAAHMGPDFVTAGKALKRVHCRVVDSVVFVCLAEMPHKQIDTFGADLGRYLAPFKLDDAKVAFETTIVEQGNWKIVWENNRECYHCDANHPELMNSFVETMSVSGVGGQEAEEERAFSARCEAAGFPAALCISPDGQYRLLRTPYFRDAVSQTMDGKAAVSGPAFADTGGLHIGDLIYFHYPSTWNHVMPDHSLSFRVTPLTATTTQVTTKWLVHKDAVEGRDYDLDNLTRVWKATNAQDSHLVAQCQIGLQAPTFVPGAFSPLVEAGPLQWLDWYCATLAANAYDAMRKVDDVNVVALAAATAK